MNINKIVFGILGCTVVSNAWCAVGDVVLTMPGKTVYNSGTGTVIGTVDLSNFITNSQLDNSLSEFIVFLFNKAEEVTVAQNAAVAAQEAVALKVNSSDLSAVAFNGNASALNNDAGWITESQASGMIASAVGSEMSGYATQAWANEKFATNEWVQSELDDVGMGMVEVARMANSATLAANAATDAVATKANAADVYTKSAADDLFALKSDVDERLGDVETLANTAKNGITTLMSSVNTLSATMDTKVDKSDVYTKSEMDSVFATQSSIDGIASELSQLSAAYENVGDNAVQMQSSIDAAQRTADAAMSAAQNAATTADFTQNLYMTAVSTIVDINTDLGKLSDVVDTKTNISDMSAVAFSGKSSDLDNDAGFITGAALDNYTTTDEMNTLLATKAAAGDVYTKSEIDTKTNAIQSDLSTITANLATLSAAVDSATGGNVTALDVAHSANETAELASVVAAGAATTAALASEDAVSAKQAATNNAHAITALETNVSQLANAVYDKAAIDDKFNALVDGELTNINTSLAELSSHASDALTDASNALQQLDGLANVARSGKSSDLDNDAGFITGETLTDMLSDKVSVSQITEMLGGVATTATVSFATVNNIDNECTVANAIESLDKTIGASMSDTTNGLSSTNTVNENIMAINNTIGDSSQMRNGNSITNGTSVMPDTVVGAINNIDQTIGKIHGLFDGTAVSATTLASTTGAGSNLAIGTTVEDHLVALDNAIGNRNIASANAAINTATAVSVSDALATVGNTIGNMDLSGTTYLGGVTNVTDALRTLDANIASGGGVSVAAIQSIENKIDHVENKLNSGMAAMSALSALVPNSRAGGKTQISVGTGTYGDQIGIAAGAFHYINNRVLLNAGASYGGTRNMAFRAGITFGW